eukprot:464875_1
MIRKYHLSTENVEMFNDALSMPVGAQYSSGYVQLHNKVYFTSVYADGSSNTNFFIYDLIDDSVVQAGLQYPKPSILSYTCYATDGIKYIYLLGGNAVSGRNTQIFDVELNRWSQGERMNFARMWAGCIYSRSNSILYAFAGDANNTIEKYSVSANKWTMLDAKLNKTLSDPVAFMTQDANTIFVLDAGSWAAVLCNVFFIDTESVYLCPPRQTVYNSHQFPNGGDYASVYIPHLQIFYTFAGSNTNSIQYAIISSTPPVDISASSTTIKNGQRVPIVISVNPNTETLIENNTFILESKELNFSYIVQIKTNIQDQCVICDNVKNENCWSCSVGILVEINIPAVNYSQQNIIASDTFYVNATASEDSFIGNIYGFDVGIEMQSVSFINISFSNMILFPDHDDRISIEINNYQLVSNEYYEYSIFADYDAFSLDLNLMLGTDNVGLQLCQITEVSTQHIYTCDEGFVFAIDYALITENANIFEISFTPNNYYSNISIFPSTMLITVVPLEIQIQNYTNYIQPGGRVPIIIFNSILEPNDTYQYNLQSSNSKYQLNYDLLIETAENNYNTIKRCIVGTQTEENPTLCEIGVKPIIEYDHANTNEFDIIITTKNDQSNTRNVSIIPSNNIHVEISMCYAGYGINNPDIADCQLCSYNEFTLKPGLGPCLHCNGDIPGITCIGGSHVIVGFNYWLSAKNSTQHVLYPFIDIEKNDQMFASFCPPGFCCT